MNRLTLWGFFASAVYVSDLAAQGPVSVKNVEMEALFRPQTRAVEAVLKVAVATPIGKIPVSGHGKLHYKCDGSFRGTMSYNRIVRFFARLKGIALVTALDGRIFTDEPMDCSGSQVHALIGRAHVDSTLMSGWVKIEGDSVSFSGPAWTFGDSTYHSLLDAKLRNKPLKLQISMYKHPRMMKAEKN